MVNTGTFSNAFDAASFIISTCKESNVWCFVGGLGAGKTTIIQSICTQLGFMEKVTSPTYAIINEYKIDSKVIYHMDLYRIQNVNELLDLGIEEYVDDKNAILLIEWPQILLDHLYVSHYLINISVLETGERSIYIHSKVK